MQGSNRGMAFNRNPPTKCFTGAGDLYQGVKALVYRIKFTFGEVERRLLARHIPSRKGTWSFTTTTKNSLRFPMICFA